MFRKVRVLRLSVPLWVLVLAGLLTVGAGAWAAYHFYSRAKVVTAPVAGLVAVGPWTCAAPVGGGSAAVTKCATLAGGDGLDIEITNVSEAGFNQQSLRSMNNPTAADVCINLASFTSGKLSFSGSEHSKYTPGQTKNVEITIVAAGLVPSETITIPNIEYVTEACP